MTGGPPSATADRDGCVMDDTVDRMNALSLSGAAVAKAELPVDCCAVMWSGWLVFVPSTTSDVEDQSVELHVVSMRLVSKNFNEAFRACNGWELCAQALRSEARAKAKVQRMHLMKAFDQQLRGGGPLECRNPDRNKAACEFILRIKTLETRLQSINSTLLVHADRLALAHGKPESSLFD